MVKIRRGTIIKIKRRRPEEDTCDQLSMLLRSYAVPPIIHRLSFYRRGAMVKIRRETMVKIRRRYVEGTFDRHLFYEGAFDLHLAQ